MLQSEFGELVEIKEELLFLREDIDETRMKISLALFEGSESNFFKGIHFELNNSKTSPFKIGNTLLTNSKKDSFRSTIS